MGTSLDSTRACGEANLAGHVLFSLFLQCRYYLPVPIYRCVPRYRVGTLKPHLDLWLSFKLNRLPLPKDPRPMHSTMRILQDLTKERTIADFEKSQELNVVKT